MSILDKLLNDWTYQISFEQDGILKQYRCHADSKEDAIKKAEQVNDIDLSYTEFEVFIKD